MKKLLYILSGLSLTILPITSTISCTPSEDNSTTNDVDYFIPELTEQPKSTDEIEVSATIAIEKSDYYGGLTRTKYDAFKLTIANWSDLSDSEKEEYRKQFLLDSSEWQKSEIWLFWFQTYKYKVFQFDPEYSKIIIPTIILMADSLEEYGIRLKNFNEKLYLTDVTKAHIAKIYNWGIQENSNVS